MLRGTVCQQCSQLETAHDDSMEEYIAVVERQSRFFRAGEPTAARDLDASIQRLKSRREAAIDALLKHRSTTCKHGSKAAQATRTRKTAAPQERFARRATERKGVEPAWPHGARLLGVGFLDDDHIALGKRVAELVELIRSGGSAEVRTALSALFEDTQAHFTREEQAMRDCEYPRVEHHKEAHHRLLEFLEFLRDDVGAGQTALDEKLIDNLWTWLNAHIATEDRAFAKHLQWQAVDRMEATAPVQ